MRSRCPACGTDRDLWAEVLVTRRRNYALAGLDSCEKWRADELTKWRPVLSFRRGMLDDSLVPGSDLDPREQLIELIAVAAAWVSAMDERSAPGIVNIIDPRQAGR